MTKLTTQNNNHAKLQEEISEKEREGALGTKITDLRGLEGRQRIGSIQEILEYRSGGIKSRSGLRTSTNR